MSFRKKKQGLAPTVLLLIFLLAVSFSRLSGQEQPLDSGGLRSKADTFLAQEDYQNAIAAYQELIAVAETQTGLTDTDKEELKNYSHYQISLAYYKQREYQKAIAEADKITTGAYLDSAYYLKGYCYQTTGQYGEATQWFEKLIAQFPGSGLFNLTRFQLARTLYFQGNRLQALLAFSRLPRLLQDYPSAPETAGQVAENIMFIVEQLKVKR